MGCGSSHEEPPRQQPTTKRPTAVQDANPHPSVKEHQQPEQQQQQQQQPSQDQAKRESTPPVAAVVESTPPVAAVVESTPPVDAVVESTPPVDAVVESTPPVDAVVESTPPVDAVVASTVTVQTTTQVATGPSWRTILMELSKEDPWGGERREDRPHWKDILEEAQRLVATPRKSLPEDMVLRALRGDVSPGGDQGNLTDRQSRVTIFISSTFTDTQAERNLLMRDVYPYLRKLCRFLGMDFGTVDMRWGVKEELTMEHGTTEICITEVNRCLRESAGPAFLAILGHKYGYRTLPVDILQPEFEKLISLLEAKSEDATIIKDFYALDTNAIPPVYVLQPRTAEDSDWWNREKKVIALFRKVADQLGEEEAEKYFISITEKEVKYGFLDNKMHEDQVICLTRNLNHVTEQHHLHRHIVDMKGGEVDTDAQKYLTELKKEKIGPKCAGVDDIHLDFDYKEDNKAAVKNYVVDTCDKTCESISRKILNAYEAHHHVIKDPIYDEVIQHQKFAAQKCEVFVGRENLIEAITNHVRDSKGKQSKVLGVFGASGCGKTALMAVAAKQVKEKVLPQATIVLRFMGTTTHSGSARAVLNSICMQIARVYGKDTNTIPTGYSELISYFHEALTFGTESQPIVVFLDSLDQLSNEDFGQNLKWLSLKGDLPPNAHVIVSSIPGGCLDALKAYLPEDNLLHVTNMSSSDGPLLLDQMLAAQNRTVTETQRKIVLDAFAKCPLPLFLRLAVDIAMKWHSYDVISHDAIADDMPGLINTLFERVESRFGALFVERALAYITCAKDGLSVGELEDILSCDDDVLDYLFDFWLPPFRRVPQLLWIRVRTELGSYLMERGTNGVNAYGWYHRQFWETAAARYLDSDPGKFRVKAHEALADYFEGKWAEGKLWTPKKLTRAILDLTPRMENRQVPRQPLALSGSRSTFRQLNRRKLAELPIHLLAIADWDRLEEQVATLEFIEAKFEAGQGYESRSFFLQVAEQSGRKTIKAISKFIGLGLPHFLADSLGVYQLAGQQAKGNPVRQLFDTMGQGLKDDIHRKFSRNRKEDVVDDPCEMTMQGHTGGVRCVRFNPKGHLIASSAEDGSVRMWDTFSGAEVVTVTDLPGPRYSGLADPYHGERPCVWDRTGTYLTTGSEDGGVQMFDTNGAQVKVMLAPHAEAVTGVDISPDNCTLVTVSKDGYLKAWSMADLSPVGTVQVGAALGCVFSPDGEWVAVSLHGQTGLKKVRVSDWSVQTAGSGHCSMNLCVDWSPTGAIIVTGGDNSCVTVWDAPSGQGKAILSGHRGWIWCVHFNASGSRLLSCSSDRSLRLWDMVSEPGVCLVTLGGHAHRVTWACFRPGAEDTFVTASLDLCLKVWDYEAVAAGRTPPAGNLHYSILECSPCAKYIATCQGWSLECSLLDSETDQVVGKTPAHKGFLLLAKFTPDSEKLITLDSGHKGAYEAGAVKNAEVKVSSEASHETILSVYGPTSIATTKEAILVGTIEDKLFVFDSETLAHVHTWTLEGSKVNFITCSLTDDLIAIGHHGDMDVLSVGRADSSLTSIFKYNRKSHIAAQMCFSPNGKYLAVGYFDGLIQIRNAGDRSFSEMYTLSDHTGKINGLAFSTGEADDFFVSAAIDMTLRVWDVKKDFQLHSVYYAPINQLGFVKSNVVVIGESTGNKNYVEFDV